MTMLPATADPAAGETSSRPSLREAHQRFLSTRRIPNLDGLRGLAIGLVLLHHVPAVDTPWLRSLQENGKHGVSLFFVISGFIVTTLLLREHRRRGAVDTRGFLWRRVLRLWPLYYAVLLLELVLVFGVGAYSPENRQLFADKLPCYLLYCSNLLETSGQGPFFVAWSLAAEEQFYLALALLLLVLPPRFLGWVCLGLLALKLGLILLWPGVDPGVLPWRVLLSYSEAIVLGVLLAVALNHPRWFGLWYRGLASPPAALLAAAICTVLLATVDLHDKSSPSSLLFYLACTALVGSCVLQGPLRVIGAGLWPWLGGLSYGIYLLHMPIIAAVKKVTDNPWLVLGLTLLVLLPLAWASFRYFEAPIRRWRRPVAGAPQPARR